MRILGGNFALLSLSNPDGLFAVSKRCKEWKTVRGLLDKTLHKSEFLKHPSQSITLSDCRLKSSLSLLVATAGASLLLNLFLEFATCFVTLLEQVRVCARIWLYKYNFAPRLQFSLSCLNLQRIFSKKFSEEETIESNFYKAKVIFRKLEVEENAQFYDNHRYIWMRLASSAQQALVANIAATTILSVIPIQE